MQIDEYIEHRLNEQLSWFSRKSASCQREYKRLRHIETVCILLLPIAGFCQSPATRGAYCSSSSALSLPMFGSSPS